MSVRLGIPVHMHEAIDTWVQHGLPHPAEMGSFMRAVLTNDLKASVMFADDENQRSLVGWVYYLHNEVPGGAHGSEEKIAEWHARGGLKGIEGRAA